MAPCSMCSNMHLLLTKTCLCSVKMDANNGKRLAFYRKWNCVGPHFFVSFSFTRFIHSVESSVGHCPYSAIMNFSIIGIGIDNFFCLFVGALCICALNVNFHEQNNANTIMLQQQRKKSSECSQTTGQHPMRTVWPMEIHVALIMLERTLHENAI